MRMLLIALGFAAAMAAQESGSIVGAAPASSGAQTSKTQNPLKNDVKPEDECSVGGKVLDAVSGAPLKKTSITMYPLDRTGTAESYSSVTDATGNFAMKDIDPGRYTLSASRTGYSRQNYGAQGPGKPGTTVTLTAAQHMTALEFKLTPQAVLTGRVVDTDGDPVERVHVTLLHSHFQHGHKELAPMNFGTTNDLGEYRISGVAPGRYYLSASVQRQGDFGTVDHTAGPKSENGFARTFYPGGNDASSAAPVDLAAGSTARLGDLRLQPSIIVHVRGSVTGTQGSNAAMIWLYPHDRVSTGMTAPMIHPVKKDGKFEIPGVTPGSYYLRASDNSGGKERSVTMPIEVGREDLDHVSLVLDGGSEISGMVKKEGDGAVSFSDVRVFLRERGQTFFVGGSQETVKDDGTFKLSDVSVSRASVEVYGLPPDAYVKNISLGQQNVTEGEADLSAASGASLEIVISTKGSQLTGLVNDANGKPKPGATVVLIPKDRERERLFKNASTDQYGQYKIAGVAPGDYTVYAFEDLELGAQMDPDYLKPVEKYAKEITVSESAVQSVPLDLIPADKTPPVE